MTAPGASPDRLRAAGVEIVRTLRDAGHTAFFAGGCVRDELLGLNPTDYDVATDARPDAVRTLFKRVNEVGASFGVMLVHIRDVTVEVATFRREGAYSDRRRPDEVIYAGPDEDAHRRDFTINALFLDPLVEPADPFPKVRGRVIDLVGGARDLRDKLIRAVGDPEARLAEDDLRALRAARFAARLGFAIEDETRAAILRHAGELVGVSRERVGEELRRMLAHPTRAQAAKLMESLDLAAPALDCRDGSESDAGPGALPGLPPDADFVTALAAWTIDRMGPAFDPDRIARQAVSTTTRLRRALCLSNDERALLRATLETLALLSNDWPHAPVARQKRAAVRPEFPGALAILHAADAPGADSIRRRVEQMRDAPPGLAPEPLLLGDDLIALGLSPGPAFKGILDAVYDAQLEGRVSDQDSARRMAQQLASRSTPPQG